MNKSSRETWVVYTDIGWSCRKVCTRSRWDRMTAGCPIYFILLQADIPSWDKAEHIARSPGQRPRARPASGDPARWPFLKTQAPNGGCAP
jgi:hypothetical protein